MSAREPKERRLRLTITLSPLAVAILGECMKREHRTSISSAVEHAIQEYGKTNGTAPTLGTKLEVKA